MAAEIHGYNGKILRVNLSSRSMSEESLAEHFCRKYVGGAGFIAYYLWKELLSDSDPLSPENKLIFATGPITGVNLPGSGRHCVGAKSPLTGGFAKSECGEFWGTELKRAGYDAVIIEGKADQPVYLHIRNGEAIIIDASHLWGRNTKEAQQKIRSELCDEHVRCALIGPAGEKLVRFACIMHGLHNAAGRGGLGAVMGSKNLKAVTVQGQKSPMVANNKSLKDFREWMLANKQMLRRLYEFGTGGAMVPFEAMGNLPVRNFRDGLFSEVNMIDASTIKETIRIGMDGCFACPIRCKKVVEVTEPYVVDPAYGGPEYETLAALGSNCGVHDLKAITKGNELCNAYGLDTISTGGVIAFAMECFERGILTTGDTGGIDLRFGIHESMLKAIELVANQKGPGTLLSEGTARMAKQLGRDSEEFAIQVKGLELGMHDPRLQLGMGLGYMVNPHGADHDTNFGDTLFPPGKLIGELQSLGMPEVPSLDIIGPPKVSLMRLVQFKRIVGDSMVFCSFLPYRMDQMADIIEAVTGWNTSVMEQLRVAQRILTTARLFNIRQGFTAEDDRLPKRFFSPKTDGALANKACDPAQMEKAKSYYYTLMGWDPHTGIPTQETLEDLEIE